VEAVVSVRLGRRKPLKVAILTTDRVESKYGQPVIIVEGEDSVRGPAQVEVVYVFADTPFQLADAAVEAGFYVLGQPRG
jgi:hypothetical protein